MHQKNHPELRPGEWTSTPTASVGTSTSSKAWGSAALVVDLQGPIDRAFPGDAYVSMTTPGEEGR